MGRESWGGWGKGLTGFVGGERWSTDVWALVNARGAQAGQLVQLFRSIL